MKVRQLRWRFYKKTGGPRGWGNRCKDYGPGCSLCEMYRFLDERGRFPTEAERWAACEAAERFGPEFSSEAALSADYWRDR